MALARWNGAQLGELPEKIGAPDRIRTCDLRLRRTLMAAFSFFLILDNLLIMNVVLRRRLDYHILKFPRIYFLVVTKTELKLW